MSYITAKPTARLRVTFPAHYTADNYDRNFVVTADLPEVQLLDGEPGYQPERDQLNRVDLIVPVGLEGREINVAVFDVTVKDLFGDVIEWTAPPVTFD